MNERIQSILNKLSELVNKLDTKVDKVAGKGLSTNDYTTAEKNKLANLENYDDSTIRELISDEAVDRMNADFELQTDLQSQIDTITSSSDVRDVVATYQDIIDYDTSTLGDNDIIKVMQDETHNNAISYYKWKIATHTWDYIGSQGPFYTKSESDELLNDKQDKLISGETIKTIDNKSILGSGNINLSWEAGSGTSSTQQTGTNSTAEGEYAVAEGLSTLAKSDYSHTEGWATRTIIDTTDTDTHGHASHAEGSHTIAKGAASHAEGNTTESIGMYSHAEGSGSVSGGISSHAEGDGTVTNNYAEHAEGTYNKSNSSSSSSAKDGTLHSVGIGTAMNDRKNAWEIMQNGDAYLKGIGRYDGTNVENADTLQTEINSKLTATGLKTINNESLIGAGNIDVSPNYRGTFNTIEEIKNISDAKPHEYVFLKHSEESGNSVLDRYEYVADEIILPTELKKCKSIIITESDTSQYINVDVKNSPTLSIELNVVFTELSDTFSLFSGAYVSDPKYRMYHSYGIRTIPHTITGGKNIVIERGSAYGSYPVSLDTTYNFKLGPDGAYVNSLYLNDIPYGMEAEVYLLLGAQNYTENADEIHPTSGATGLNILECKISDPANNIDMHLIPCYTLNYTEDGVAFEDYTAGMYDIINHKFMSSDGGTNFAYEAAPDGNWVYKYTLQDKLISGTNIKTIGGNSIFGEGDISLEPEDYVKDVKVNGESVVDETGVANVQISGGGGGMEIVDEDNNITYSIALKIRNGKPIMEYDIKEQ